MSLPLTPAELDAEDTGTTLIIDVRGPGEYAAGHVPGALNLPLDSLPQLLDDVRAAAARRELIVVCAAGMRSATACAQLAAAGIEARGLEGGTDAWRAAGLPVETAALPERNVWAMDRQVRFTAGSLVLVGLAGSLVTPWAALLSAGIAGGLVYSGVSNTCGMAVMLGKLPFNRPRPAALAPVREALQNA
ncbi:rhodanese-like domain-containing protein [Streptomyces sp. N35]|uniref:rhodanese-like domain-containing protein n=1 Tax=Streptomyces sp. N35 TaxID=2795730 RepID=UPI0018F54CAC|nr:rhodanese-like domain-containing protein [Streptomyces sp. N35]